MRKEQITMQMNLENDLSKKQIVMNRQTRKFGTGKKTYHAIYSSLVSLWQGKIQLIMLMSKARVQIIQMEI